MTEFRPRDPRIQKSIKIIGAASEIQIIYFFIYTRIATLNILDSVIEKSLNTKLSCEIITKFLLLLLATNLLKNIKRKITKRENFKVHST